MNSHELKLTKTCELPELLEMGFDYAFAGRMTVTSIEKRDENDGNFTFTYKGQLTHIEVINKLGATLKAVAKGSNSEKWRNIIGTLRGFSEYDAIMGKMLKNPEKVLDFLDTL